MSFRCVKCDDKEYGIAYYEKVFSLFMVSEVEEGNIKKKITVVPAGMNYSATGGQQTAVSSSCLYIYIYKSNHLARTRLQKLIIHVIHFWVTEFNKYARD